MSHDRARARTVRSVVFLATGVLALPALAGCGADDEAGQPTAGQDLAPAARELVADGGTVNWAVDAVPETLNSFQSDADGGTSRVAGAVLPSLFRLDAQGRAQRNADFLESAKVVEREPQQVVLYKLNQQAVWSDGREIGADDFAAQWRALSGKDSAYWTARNAGYDRIAKVERGANNLEVRVTFNKPYADWRSLFTPLYPKDVMGTPDAFNDGARRRLKATAGPFAIDSIDRKAGDVTLVRNPRWWGRPAKLAKLVLRSVPRDQRAAAIAAGRVDLAEIDAPEADRIARAARDNGAKGPLTHGPGAAITPAKALRSWAVAHGSDEEAADSELLARKRTAKAVKRYAKEQEGLRGYVVRKSLEPAYTQLALNGAEGPLADDRVRRAVARALNRTELAKTVLGPLGLPAKPVGSHLALAGQLAYADNSGALGEQDTAEAQALLADAGWTPGGPVKEKGGAAGSKSDAKKKHASSESEEGSDSGDDGTYIVGEDDKPAKPAKHAKPAKPGDNGTSVLAPAPVARHQTAVINRQAEWFAPRREADKEKKKDPGGHAKQHRSEAKSESRAEAKAEARAEKRAQRGGAPGAYAPKGTAAPAAVGGPLAKDGKPLTLRFVLPSGQGSESLRSVADRISRMLERIGVRTEISKVADESYFKDHIASGQYDLALYSWPASAFPATDARPIFAKPVPAADGSLNVEQNYTRVGSDRIDQLFDQALGELDEDEERDLVRKADARIWAEAGSIPLYQRPQLVATRPGLANAGAFGFQAPNYEDIGFLKPSAKPSGSPSAG
ncbi:ABC transporter family substrate-binding protein [Actinomycetota bacterium Odt1-20B]